MPVVKGKHYPYTKKGVTAAKKAAKKTGKSIRRKRKSERY
jgi:hypothetical protein